MPPSSHRSDHAGDRGTGSAATPDLPVSDVLRGYSTEFAAQPESRVPEAFAALLPRDTVSAAEVTAGVRLELRGTAPCLDIRFDAIPGPPRAARTMPPAFSVWAGGYCHRLVEVTAGDSLVRIPLPSRGADETVTVYLPESIGIRVTGLSAPEGTVTAAPRGPRWLAYGDSITQGWSATDPGRSWPSIVARRSGLDLVNLGLAGAARGELPAADHLAATPADVITLAWGTNCWSTIPFDAELIGHAYRLFLTAVRAGHPGTPLIVLSPLVRPDAEHTPNRFGATLAELRAAIEVAVRRFRDDHDDRSLRLIPGEHLVPPEQLVDGIHPGDAGHARIADAFDALLPDTTDDRDA